MGRARYWITLLTVVTTLQGFWQTTPAEGAPGQVAPPPPTCTANFRPTAAQTEGPYYKRNSPQRRSLVEPGMSGTRIIITGRVLTTDCTPIPGAWLDFWQADDRGQYDNSGFRLRGHQFTDSAGVYRLETILPGLYPGRTRHIHVKVRAPSGPILTTQLYFAGEAQNQRDAIFDSGLVVTLRDEAVGKVATFNFVLDVRR